LLEVTAGVGETGFLGELAAGGLRQVLTGADEAAGQRPLPLEGGAGPADEQDAQLLDGAWSLTTHNHTPRRRRFAPGTRGHARLDTLCGQRGRLRKR
jgi:hypothetical protein